MIKVIGIGGVPASGKSTLIRRLLPSFGDGTMHKVKLLKYHLFPPTKTVLLGVYGSGKGFEGTDKLSMSVQPEAVSVIRTWAKSPSMDGWTVLFEGDRLFNQKFLRALESMENVETNWLVLGVSEDSITARQNGRGNKQSESWLRGRYTKVANLVDEMGLRVLANDTEDELAKNARLVQLMLRG